jgi:hypothetical protein
VGGESGRVGECMCRTGEVQSARMCEERGGGRNGPAWSGCEGRWHGREASGAGEWRARAQGNGACAVCVTGGRCREARGLGGEGDGVGSKCGWAGGGDGDGRGGGGRETFRGGV